MGYLAITVFVLWCVSEIGISFISLSNRSRAVSRGEDRFSYFVVWLSTIPPIGLEYVIRSRAIFGAGFGDFSALFPLIGYVGCLLVGFGITIRLAAVVALKKQFTLTVSLVERHELIETGVYRFVRHPAYLGHLVSLLGIGVILGNSVGLAALVVLPLAGIVYRIHVEESALFGYFGAAYQAYARRTKRLLPGIW